jgi:hypothetical protein
MSAFLAVFLLNKLTGIAYANKAIKLLGKAILVTAAQTRVGVGAFWLLNGVLVGALDIALAGAATAFWALDAAIAANPVGALVLAIAAVAAGFYLAYTKVGWFRDAVNGTFAFIRDHWPLLLAILTGPIGLAVLYVVQHFDELKAKVGGVIDWIEGKLRGLLGLPGKALGKLAGGLGGLAKGAGSSLIPGFANGGIVRTPLQMVHGGELAALPMGSHVFTRQETTHMLRAPRTESVRRDAGAASAGGSDRPIYLRSEITVKVSERVLAKVVNDEVARHDGRR